MKKIVTMAFYFLTLQNILFGFELPKVLQKYNINFAGELSCKKERLLVIGSEQGEHGPPFTEGYYYKNTFAFDIDEDLNIYIFDWTYIYKYSTVSDSLLWELHPRNNILDFKYFNEKICTYEKDRIRIFNAGNRKIQKEISLNDLELNRTYLVNLSYFYNNFLFIHDLTLPGFVTRLKYIYDFENDLLSEKLTYDRTFSPITNCDGCDANFIEGLFDANIPINYEGQSDKYIIFGYYCNPSYLPANCDDKKTVTQFYVFNKIDKSFRLVNENFDWGGTFYGFDFDAIRACAFINDTTFVYQTYVKNEDKLKEKVVYYKLTFKGWP